MSDSSPNEINTPTEGANSKALARPVHGVSTSQKESYGAAQTERGDARC